MSVPREPVVWPAPSSRVVSTTTRTRSGSMPSSSIATCAATVCTPWPISVQQWRTSTVPSCSKRTTARTISRKPLPRPEFFKPEPEADRLARGDRRVVRGLHRVEAPLRAAAAVVHHLAGTPHRAGRDHVAAPDLPTR